MTRLAQYLAPAALILLILLVWEAACRLLAVPTYVLPAPSQVLAAGLADAHAGALSAATQFSRGVLGLGAALAAIGVALVANSIVKCVVAFVAGGGRFGGRFTLGLLPSVLTVVGCLIIVWSVSN